MLSFDLRIASPLTIDRHRQDQRPQSQDESFQAPPHGHSLHNPVVGSATDIADSADVEEESGDNQDEDKGLRIQSRHGSNDHISQIQQDLIGEPDHAVPSTELPQIPHAASESSTSEAPTPNSDDTTPWLDFVQSLQSSHTYNTSLPFGLHFSSAISASAQGGIDQDMDVQNHSDATSSVHTVNEGHDHMDESYQVISEQHHAVSSTQHAVLQWGTTMAGTSSLASPQGAYDHGESAFAEGDLPFGFVPGGSDEPDSPPHVVQPAVAQADLSPGPDLGNGQPAAPTEENLPQLMPSTTNPMIMGSENVGLVDFLRLWAHRGPVGNTRSLVPDLGSIYTQANRQIPEITVEDLRGDRYDFQGLDWTDMGTTRSAARTRRHISYKNYVNRDGSDCWKRERSDVWIPSTESYFRFRQMAVRSDVSLAHFQLRSVLACPSRSQAFFPCSGGINRFNPISNKSEVALNLGPTSAFGRTITTLDANCEVLVAGTFSGHYLVKPLHSQDNQKFSEGIITSRPAGITNHLQVHSSRRTSAPLAAISSNDCGLRILDIKTEQIIADFSYRFPLNCSTVSPDRRLRAIVGDTKDVIITNAETGEPEVKLSGHDDYGFSCDWSEDGRFVATGFQDKSVKIWDCRKWSNTNGQATPVACMNLDRNRIVSAGERSDTTEQPKGPRPKASLWCEMAGARSLRFSPLGSGEPVLIAAEEADFINIIDARTFQQKQTIDLFGEIGGVDFADGGQELNILVSDPHRGGLLQFDRCATSSASRRRSMIDDLPVF